MSKKLLVVMCSAWLAGLCGQARADDLSDALTQAKVDGELRAYDFSRWYDSDKTPDAHAFSMAALINAQTGAFLGGFSVGVSVFSATSLGTHSDTLAKIDTTLAGPNNSITGASQAFLQFQNYGVLFRGGYQYLDNPWMGNNDSRIIPSSYNAVSLAYSIQDNWKIIGIREFEWKSRTSTGMFKDNLYYPSTYDGDSMYGNNGSLPITAPKVNGTWSVGTTYVSDSLKAEAWYNSFLDLTRMGYLNGSYTFHTDTPFNPSVALQYLNENGGGDSVLVETHTKLFGEAGDRVRAEAWGADVGTTIFDGRIDFAYNKLNHEDGAVGGGALISPYTSNYGTDPLFTTSMIRGLVETGPGHAWKAKAMYNFFNKQLQLVAAYAKYDTDYRGDSHDLYFDIIYHLDGWLKGLTLRNRWERSAGGIDNLNPNNQAFTYDRVMISYKF
ncbi:hypothetical protein [Dyella sp. C9]|uniref:hypothetical protein n=1 Tax=Dyella sp. C9 TaxID=2202154 RepID=UPI000DEF1F0A|nr:hypothetical protein [Dyella sp. C9]